MAKQQMIDTDAVVQLLGVPKSRFSVCKTSLPDFPAGIGKKGCVKLYSRNAILKWRKTHDIRSLINELDRARYRRRVQPAASSGVDRELDLSLAQRFLRGEFATAEQKQHYAMKKLAARNCHHPILQRITVRPDWMD